MAKRKYKTYTYAEAQVEIPKLPFEDHELLEPIRAARKRVLANPDCEYSRRSVRDEAGCRMDKVIKILPLIEAIERGPGQDTATHEAGEMPPLPVLAGSLTDLLKNMHSNVIQFGNAAAALMRDDRIQEHERTKSAFESQKNSAEFALNVMAHKNDEAEDTTHVMVDDYVQLRREHDDAQQYILQVKQDCAKLEDEVTKLKVSCVNADERASRESATVAELRTRLEFEQNRVASLVEALIRKAKPDA